MSAKHSPGPWRVDWGQAKDADSAVIADLWDRSEPPQPLGGERLKANAALIAAAPEMLALLREALPDPVDALQVAAWLERVRALLKRLEG